MSRPFSSADAFRAVADPTRRRILDLLRRREMTVGEIAESLPISGAALSFHLRVLRHSDLAVARRRGRHLAYTVNLRPLRAVTAWLNRQRDTGAAQSSRTPPRELLHH